VLLTVACAMGIAGCGRPAEPPNAPPASQAGSTQNAPKEPTQPVIALVAASTADAVKELIKDLEKQKGVVVEVSPGPSNGLAQQILKGAPADVFLSASENWVDALRKEGRVAETRPLLTNRLVVVVPRGRGANIRQPSDLSRAEIGKLALGGEKVPIGTYADQALKHLKLLDPLVADGKIVRGHDARATLAYVEQGEADAGIVYQTDAMISDKVETAFVFDASTHGPILYSAVLVKPAQNDGGDAPEPTADARKAYEFLFTTEAMDVFRKFGFSAVGGDKAATSPATEGR
jgi:molybdate transport system substrate-binding protein